MLLRYLQVVCLLLFATSVTAHDNISSIYHPLPLQAQGLFLTAKKMFPGTNGGFWLHDIHGNIRFFDGQHVLPRVGSIIDRQVDEVAFLNQAFWYVEGNKLYKAVPAKQPVSVAVLDAEVELTKIGSSDGFIWMTDNHYFYVYDPDTSHVHIHPLKGIHLQINEPLEITDALLIKNTWLFGTTSGVYRYSFKELLHERVSGSKYIQKLHYSKTRNELLVGGPQGAVLIDISRPKKIKARIGHSLVRAIVESEEGYWVGTEHGLYTYRFTDRQVREIGTSYQDDLALSNNFVYSLVNDKQGGIWIATSQEIRYYSKFSELFQRIRFGEPGHQVDIGSINQVVTDKDGTHWIATEKGLYMFRTGIDKAPSRRLYKPVYDLAMHDDFIWLATDNGIVQYQKKKHLQWPKTYPGLLVSRGIRNLLIDSEGILWFDSPQGLIRYRIRDNVAENLGFSWMVENKPGRVTHLYASNNGQVFIGTDHGIYLYSDERIRYLKASAVLGQSIDMVDTEISRVWFTNSYGLYLSMKDTWQFETVTLNEPNIRVFCTLSTAKGIWSATSKGLSFYKHDGRLMKHFGAPFGLVNNEFLPDICSYDPIRDELIFGSLYGLVLAKQNELISAELPDSSVLFSQIVVNNKPYRYAFGQNTTLFFPYDSSLNFRFGVLPDFDQSNLQYRLNGSNKADWITMQGTDLAFSSLFPGEYELYVRTEVEATQGQKGSLLKFVIKKPWYLSTWAFVLFLILTVLLMTLLIYWRSVRVVRRNRYLQGLVELKTKQLEHQSRILITNNYQLRMKLSSYIKAEEREEITEKKASDVTLTSEASNSSSKEVKQNTWLLKVYALIEKEYMHPEFGTSLASRSLFVSERSLQRKFKSLTGRTFTEYLHKVRLEKACELLLSGEKISDVAFDTGFNDPSYFSQRFKNYFGISPSKFIESRSEPSDS